LGVKVNDVINDVLEQARKTTECPSWKISYEVGTGSALKSCRLFVVKRADGGSAAVLKVAILPEDACRMNNEGAFLSRIPWDVEACDGLSGQEGSLVRTPTGHVAFPGFIASGKVPDGADWLLRGHAQGECQGREGDGYVIPMFANHAPFLAEFLAWKEGRRPDWQPYRLPFDYPPHDREPRDAVLIGEMDRILTRSFRKYLRTSRPEALSWSEAFKERVSGNIAAIVRHEGPQGFGVMPWDLVRDEIGDGWKLFLIHNELVRMNGMPLYDVARLYIGLACVAKDNVLARKWMRHLMAAFGFERWFDELEEMFRWTVGYRIFADIAERLSRNDHQGAELALRIAERCALNEPL
jgi:hypothetical protein